ncbi:MAG: thymidine kinase [Tissierellales bacterium]
MAKLYFRYGAMNCGKSTNLMQVAYNYEERGMKIIIIKPVIDTKGGDKVISRLGIDRKVDLLLEKDKNAYEEVERWNNENWEIDCILVDEAQFFTEGQIDEFFEIAVKMNIPVICYGLRTDFQMKGFEGSERLLLIAHSIEELKTICSCGKKAIFNGRKVNGKFIFEGAQVAIENEDDIVYESLCGECYFREKQN